MNRSIIFISYNKTVCIFFYFVIAFGDNYNDIEMIEFAGVGVAMENGEEELKKSADYIALNNNDDGVGKFLKDFLEL